MVCRSDFRSDFDEKCEFIYKNCIVLKCVICVNEALKIEVDA